MRAKLKIIYSSLLAVVVITGSAIAAMGGTHAAPSCYAQTWKQGSSGQCVKDIQNLLNYDLYSTNSSQYLTLDGQYGSYTTAAVKQEQKNSGITVNGTVNTQTWPHVCTPGSGSVPSWYTSAATDAGCPSTSTSGAGSASGSNSKHVTYTLKNLSATVDGTSVTATATVAASVNTTAQYAGICVRDASNNNFDFNKAQNIVLTTNGTVLNGPAQTLAVGTYTYFACVDVQNLWTQVGNSQSFTVSNQPAPVTYTLSNLSATVNGTSVTATATVAASVDTTAQSAGICVNDASNNSFNFPMSQNVTLTTSGTVLNGAAQTLAPGTYTYYACITAQNISSQVGNSKTFTVNSTGTGGGSLPYASALSGYSNLSQSFTAQDMINGNWAQNANDTQEGGGTCSTSNTAYDATNDAVKLSTNGLPTNQNGATCGKIRSASLVPTKNAVIESKIWLPGNSPTTMLDWASFWTDGANSSGVENWPITGEVDAVETNFGQSFVSIHCGCMQDYNAASYGPTENWTTEPSGWEDKDTTYATTSAPNVVPGWNVVDIAFNADGSAGIYYNGTLYVTVPASALTWNTGYTYVNWGISGAYDTFPQSTWPTGSGYEEVQYLKVFTQ